MIKINIDNNNIGHPFNTRLLIPKENLFGEIWVDNALSGDVSKRLLELTNSIIDSMDIKVKIRDVIITGSIASYNWHDMSDIDLHIMLDFTDINNDFSIVKKYLDQSRINWNKTHDILIHGKEVELYFQDTNEPHESNGIWSLIDKKWLAEPVKFDAEVDLKNSEKKAEALAQCIIHAEELFKEQEYQSSYDFSSKLKRKISKLRQSGLKRDGLYSQENLAFKMLRNSGYLELLSWLKIKSFDKKMSLNEIYDYFPHKESDFHEFEGSYDVAELLKLGGHCPWEYDRD